MSSDGTSGHLLAMTDKVKAALKVNFNLYLALLVIIWQDFYPMLFYVWYIYDSWYWQLYFQDLFSYGFPPFLTGR